jgi:CRP-like cAMP-binding protein/cytochrome P450/bacterioferritin-associated ferredoxin
VILLDSLTPDCKLTDSVSLVSSSDRAVLLSCSAIAALDERGQQSIFQSASIINVGNGEAIVRQGEIGESFYVILDGSAEVVREEQGGRDITLAQLGAGDYFGEQALIGSSPGPRKASVRALKSSNLARISARVFLDNVAVVSHNREVFDSNASDYLFNQVRRSIESFVLSEPAESRPGIERRFYSTGDIVMQQGECSDAAYLIVEGVVAVRRTSTDGARELARLGEGQFFGEFGVLRGEPRTASVVAQTTLILMRIEAEQFSAWHQSNEYLGGFVDSFTDLYQLSETRRVNIFRGKIDGEDTITALCGIPEGRVVSTRLLERGALVFANTAAVKLPGERDSVIFEHGDVHRKLRLIVTQRRNQRIERAVVHGLEARNIGSDLGTLYRSVAELEEVCGRELRRFQLTGFLGGDNRREDHLCPCLGLGERELREAVDELGDGLDALRKNFGAGAICGGCEPALQNFLQELSPARQAKSVVSAAKCPASHDGSVFIGGQSEPTLNGEERWLSRMLRPWACEVDGRIGRREVSLKLRGLGAQSLNAFIDSLFGSALSCDTRLTADQLAAAVSQASIGFNALTLPPTNKKKVGRLLFWFARKYRVVPSLLLAFFSAVGVFVGLNAGDPLVVSWVLCGLALVGIGAYVLAHSRSCRFAWHFVWGGLESYYRALFSVLGQESKYAEISPYGRLGKTMYILRDELMINRVLQNPDIYSRTFLVGYPPFGVHSVLGSGTSGKWLGFRSMCEEYFVDGFRDDLRLIEEMTRQRVKTWLELGEINLLDELYRIIIEVRGQVFFQASFDCFRADAPLDMARLVDDILSPPIAFYGIEGNGENEILYQVLRRALEKSSRPGSVGKSLRDHHRAGDISEVEMLENAALFLLAQAPTMGIFWTLYRTAHDGSCQKLRQQKGALVQAIKEELRIHPAVTSLLTRTTTCDDKNGELSLPEGAEVFISPLYVHTNPVLWKDPFSFQPECWTVYWNDARDLINPLTDEKDIARRRVPLGCGQPSMRYLPFGSGPQACQARHFAPDEMLSIIRVILDAADLEVIEDHGLLQRPLEEQIKFHVYTRPVHDVRVRVRPASPNQASPLSGII